MISRFDARAARVAAGGAQPLDYPIELLASSKSTRFQMGFARMTMHLLPRWNDVALEACESGLRILGANEIALELPRETIREIHADDVEIGEPQVRFFYGQTVQEPVMWVRVAAPRTYTEPVLHDLIVRGAHIDEVDWLQPAPVVSARAPLRHLLGYPEALSALAENTAELRMWLSHYAPVPPEPGNAA